MRPNEKSTPQFKTISSLGAIALPTCNEYKEDVDSFVKDIESYIASNRTTLNSTKKLSNGLTIGSTIIGVGGGAYGLFSNGEQKGAALTSLVAGAITGLIGTFAPAKKIETGSACSEFLNTIKIQFKNYWSAVNCPTTQAEWDTYKSAKKEIIDQMVKMKCYGTY